MSQGSGRSIASFISGSLFAQTTTFATGVALARYLGPSDYGVLSIVRNILSVAMMVAPFGMDLSLLRYLSATQLHSSELLERFKFIRLVICVGSCALAATVAFVVGPLLSGYVYNVAGLQWFIFLGFLALPFTTDLALLGAAFRAFNKPVLQQIASLYVFPTVRTILIVVAIVAGAGVAGVLVATSAAAVAAAFVAWVLFARMVTPQNAGSPPYSSHDGSLVSLFRYSSWHMACLVLYGSIRSIDVLTVGAFCEPATTGSYAALTAIALLISVVAQSLSQTLGPAVASYYAAGDSATVTRLLDNYLRSASLVTAPLFAAVAAFSPWLVVVFGDDYRFDTDVSLLLATGYWLSSVYAPMGYALSMTGRHREEAAVLLLSFATALVGALSLTPSYGPVGAAFAVLASFMLGNACRVTLVHRSVGITLKIAQTLTPPTVALCVAFGVRGMGMFVDVSVWSSVLMVMLYLIILAVVFYAFVFSNSEKTALRICFGKVIANLSQLKL